jgi:alkylhydroperoxidase/carboxymuconolactone decarboxylase family protein YurZ
MKDRCRGALIGLAVGRGLAAGLTREEMEHVAVLAITTLGWPSALAAVSWIVEEIDKTK